METRSAGARGLAALACACLTLALGAASASAAPTWLAPQDLSASGQHASAPQVGLDAAGNAVAIWRRFDGSNSIVQVSERPAGADWSEPENLSVLGQNALQPQLAVNPAGDAVAVWRGGGVNGIVKAAVRPAGGDWSEPEDLSAPGPNAEMPRVAIDASGDAVAVWLHSTFLPGDASTFVVQAATRPAGGDWSEPENLADQGHNLDGPKVAVNPAGDAMAVWQARVGSDNVYQAASRPAGGDWSGPDDIADAGPGEASPVVALGPAGDAVAVWARLFSGIVQAAERPAGGDWSDPEDLSAAGGDAASPRLAVDATGDALAAWQRSDGSNSIVQVSERPAGGDWSDPDDLSAAGQDANGPQIALNAAGDAVAAWRRSNGSNEIVQASARRVGGAWSPAQDLSAVGRSAFAPAVAIDAAGDAAAVWWRSNGSSDIVQAAVYDAVAPQLSGLQIPASGTVGQPLSFAVSPFDAFTALAATNWSFGDGGAATGTAVSHVYATAGTYQVTVTAVDRGGNASTQTGTVAIAGPPPIGIPSPPVVTPPPPVVTPPPPTDTPKATLSLAIERKSLRKLLRSGRLVVTATVDKAGKVALAGKAKLRVRVRGKLRTRLVPVFRGKTARFAKGGEKEVKLRLTRKGRRALSNLRKARLVIVGTATAADGETVRKRAALTLRR